MSVSGCRLRTTSMARLRVITASHGPRLPRLESNPPGFLQSCMKMSCNTSSAAPVSPSTRKATEYTTPEYRSYNTPIALSSPARTADMRASSSVEATLTSAFDKRAISFRYAGRTALDWRLHDRRDVTLAIVNV